MRDKKRGSCPNPLFLFNPDVGTDPFRHHIDVDLSHERMARAWEAYKVRWAREEDAMMRLMEKKVVSEN